MFFEAYVIFLHIRVSQKFCNILVVRASLRQVTQWVALREYQVSLAARSSVWFVTFEISVKVTWAAKLCFILHKYRKTFDSPKCNIFRSSQLIWKMLSSGCHAILCFVFNLKCLSSTFSVLISTDNNHSKNSQTGFELQSQILFHFFPIFESYEHLQRLWGHVQNNA